MTQSQRNIIVFGKTDLTPEEAKTCEKIGWALYFTNRQLHTAKSAGVSAHIAKGYRLAGGKPVLHSSGAGDIPGPVIAVLDARLIAQLDAAVPDWEGRDWMLISDEQTLNYVADTLLENQKIRAEQGNGTSDDPVEGAASSRAAPPSGPSPHSVDEPGKAPTKSRGPSRSTANRSTTG